MTKMKLKMPGFVGFKVRPGNLWISIRTKRTQRNNERTELDACGTAQFEGHWQVVSLKLAIGGDVPDEIGGDASH